VDIKKSTAKLPQKNNFAALGGTNKAFEGLFEKNVRSHFEIKINGSECEKPIRLSVRCPHREFLSFRPYSRIPCRYAQPP